MSRYSDQVLADGAIAYWRLGEAIGVVAQDAHPTNNNDGVYTGTPTLGVAGALVDEADTAVSFPGSAGSYVTVPDANPLDLGNGPFTLECWLKRATSSGGHGLISKQGSYRLSILATTSKLALRRSGSNIATSTPGITDTTGWHHCVATKQGTTPLLYIDGADVTGVVTDLVIADSTTALLLGSSSTTAEPLNGALDEIALYNLVLTPAQILEHYLLGRSKFGAASLAGDGGLTAAGVRARIGAGALAGEGGLAASGRRARCGAAALVGEAALVAAGKATFAGAAILGGESSLAASGIRARSGQAALQGEGLLVASGRRARLGAAALSGEGALSAVGRRARIGAAILAGAAELVAAGRRARYGAASLAGEGLLVAVSPGSGIPGSIDRDQAGHITSGAPGRTARTSPGDATPAGAGHVARPPVGHLS